jgi:hypothetical protein
VKAVLTGTTQPYGPDGGAPLPDPIADGRGLIDVSAAMNVAAPSSPSGSLLPSDPGGTVLGTSTTQTIEDLPPANLALRPADAFARTLFPVLRGTPLRWKDPLLGGLLWNTLTWDSVVWDSVAWDNFDWDSVAWDSVAWDSVAWDSVAWDSVAWDSVAWDSVAWDSLTLD